MGAALSCHHPFSDGDKHASFLGIGAYLELNAERLVGDRADATFTIPRLAAGELTIEDLAAWVRQNLV